MIANFIVIEKEEDIEYVLKDMLVFMVMSRMELEVKPLNY